MSNSTFPEHDPWAVVHAVASHLTREGLRARLVGEQISEAKYAAEALLRAFNVEPVTPDYDALEAAEDGGQAGEQA